MPPPIKGLDQRRRVGRGTFARTVSAALMPIPALQFPITVFPDRIDSLTYQVKNQLAVTELPPKPEHTIALDSGPIFPTRIDSLSYQVKNQLAVALPSKPEHKVALDSDTTFPDSVSRPMMLTSEQMAICNPPRAGILFRSKASAATIAGLTMPPGTVPGETIVAFITNFDDITQTLTPPDASWVLRIRGDGVVGDFTSAVYTHLVVPGDTGPWTWTSTAPATDASGALLTYAGVDKVTPWDRDSNATNGTGTAATAPSIGLTTNGEKLLYCGINASVPLNVIQSPPEMFQRETQVCGGGNSVASIAEQAMIVQGATGTRTGTLASDNWFVLMGALLPEGTFQPPPSVYPDAVLRPVYQVRHQQPVTNISPLPINFVVGWDHPTFPESIRRPFYLTTEQQAFVIGKRNARVAGADYTSTSGATTSTTVAVTRTIAENTAKSGGALVFMVSWDNALGETLLKVEDTVNGQWPTSAFLEAQEDGALDQATQMWVLPNRTPGSITITATFSVAAAFRRAAVIEANDVGFNPVDGHHSNEQNAPGTGTDAVTTGNAVNANQPGVLVGFSYATDNGRTGPNPGTGFIDNGLVWDRVAPTSQEARIESKYVTVAGQNQAATFTAVVGEGGADYVSFAVVLDENNIANPSITFNDTVVGTRYPTHEQLFVSPFLTPPIISQVYGWDPVFPPSTSRVWLSVSNQQAFAISAKPERTSTIAIEVHPDRLLRPFFDAWQQLAVTELSPKPERTSPLAAEWHEDRPWRPSYSVTQQLASTELSPQPERTSPIAVEVHEDRPWRPAFAVAQQLAVTELSPKPERTTPIAAESHADLNPWRPVFSVVQQLAVTEISPKPERTSPIAAEWHEDRSWRPIFGSWQQLAVTEISPQPERTAPMFPELHEDRPWRPFFSVVQQLAATEISPQPEQTIALAWQPSYPDRAVRPAPAVYEQPSFAFYTFPFPAAPSVPYVVYPDGVVRPYYQTPQQQAYAANIQPERTSAIAVEVHPDRIVRPSFDAWQQLAITELSPKPERTSPLAAEWHEDRFYRPIFGSWQQLAVTELSPQPERTSPLAAEWHEDRFYRPIFGAWQQLAVTELSPQPERTSTLAAEWHVDLTPWRPTFGAWQQLAITEISPKPERTSTIAVEVHEDRPWRPFYATAQQLAVTEISPQPEQTIALAWQPNYPDRAVRPVVLASQQPSFAFYAFPFPTAPGIPYVIYPDGVVRPYFLASRQQAYAANVQPERTSPIAVEVHEDRPWRPAFAVAQQLAVTELSPKPEQTIALAWQPVYPDRALRPVVLPSLQPSFAFYAFPIPGVTQFFVIFPTGVVRPIYPPHLQQSYAANIAPERTRTLAAEWHEDRPWRPSFGSWQQLAVTELSPKPERTSPIAVEVHPDKPIRPAYPPHLQAFAPWLPVHPIVTAPLIWQPFFPERILRPAVPAAQQATSYTSSPYPFSLPVIISAQMPAPRPVPLPEKSQILGIVLPIPPPVVYFKLVYVSALPFTEYGAKLPPKPEIFPPAWRAIPVPVLVGDLFLGVTDQRLRVAVSDLDLSVKTSDERGRVSVNDEDLSIKVSENTGIVREK